MHSMTAPSLLATPSTFLNYKDNYIPSASMVNDQGVVSTPHIKMDHTYSSQTSSYKWKTHMTT